MADQALLAQAKAALSALAASPGEEAPQMQAVEEALAPLNAQPAAPAPSAETLQLAQASTDELDAELLEIFLEEAREVLATIDSNLALLRRQPHDVDTLTTIRRSSHTLKGSGRMVGLKDLGETAWAVEQTLNQWLRQELEVTPELLEMIALTHQVFSVWVEHLASGDGLMPDPQPLITLAERLRGVETPAQAAPASPVEPAPVPAAPVGAAPAEAVPAEAAAPETAPEASPEPVPETALDTSPLDADLSEAVIAPETAAPEDIPADLLASRFDLGPLDGLEEEVPPAPLPAAAPDTAGLMTDLEFSFDLGTESETPESLPRLETGEEPALPEAAAGEPGDEPPAQAEAEAEAEAEVEVEVEAEAATEPTAAGSPLPASQTLTISPQLYEIFRDEARGHMDTLHRFLEELAQTPTMPTPFETGRAAHTLAGIAGTVGIAPINKLGQALEHALLRRDAAQHPDSLEGLEVLRQTMDMLESMLERMAQGQMPDPQPILIDALSQLYPARMETRDKDMETVLGEALEAIEPAPESGAEATPDASASPLPLPPETVPQAELPPLLHDEMDEQLLPIFLEEAQELVEGFQTQIAAWKADPGGSAAPNALARLLHTFKGSSRMAGAMNLGQLTHAVESRVSELAHTAQVTPADLDEIETACDLLAQTVERYQAGDFSLPAAPASPAAPEAPRAEATAPAAAAPAPVSIAPASMAAPELPEPEAGQKALLRVRADLVDQLVNEAGELSIARARIEGEMRELKESLLDLTGNVIRLRHQLREIEIQAESQIQANTRHETKADFDPLELDRFTRFQELTRMMAESVNDVATVQQNLLKNLDDANAALVAQARLNRSLQQSLMSVRMVPFSSQSERLYRLVRQTAKEVGKRANLELQGGQVELDRSVLEKILPPLEHMLRNAVAHGLESRDRRLAAGKEEIGEISLSLAQEGNEIILSLADDGAGLDLERIRAKAEAAGLIAPGEAVDEQRLVNFIFHSGFSTATEVSQVAGRGVGMDVVKTEVTGLGGRVEVFTEPGRGTTFRLYLPLTLAVTQTVLVKVGERLFAIPSAMIEQVMEIREKALDEMRAKGEAVWQDHHYPFHYLPRLLGDEQTQPEHRRLYWVLLLRSGTQRVAVQVDEMKGNQEIVVKNVGPQMARVVGIAGATVLGDGQVVLILNPVALATRMPDLGASVERVQPQAIEAVPAPAPVLQQPTILVVDDSLTVRKITSKLLSREGYQVELAKDGVDALEQLIDKIPDVILSDIEMPRMDGFDLVRNIRADERLIHVPIIMITSRTADKHRNYAMEIGANHYLGKPYDEEELLRLLAEYTGRA